MRGWLPRNIIGDEVRTSWLPCLVRLNSLNKEEWLQYEETLGHFFVVNSVLTNEKKRAVFLSI